MLKYLRLFVGKDFAASRQAMNRGKDFPAGNARSDETYTRVSALFASDQSILEDCIFHGV